MIDCLHVGHSAGGLSDDDVETPSPAAVQAVTLAVQLLHKECPHSNTMGVLSPSGWKSSKHMGHSLRDDDDDDDDAIECSSSLSGGIMVTVLGTPSPVFDCEVLIYLGGYEERMETRHKTR